MFNKGTVKSFIFGFITYFIVASILDFFGINTIIVKTIMIAIIGLIVCFIAQLHNKHKK